MRSREPEELIMNITPKTQKILLIIYGAGIFVLSLYIMFLYFKQETHLICKDCIYYMAIADNILQSGVVKSLDTIPPQPVISPQNGIVIFYLILSIFGLGLESRMVTIVIINYLLHLTALYPLYKIAWRVGLRETLPLAALLGVYVASYPVLRAQLIPNNDGVFNSLTVWLVYLILMLYDETKQQSFTSRWWVKLALAATLASILVHFRLQTFPVLGAAFLAALIAREYRSVLWTSGLLGIAAVSLGLLYTQVDTSGISKTGGDFVSSSGILSSAFLWRLLANANGWANNMLPTVLFTNGGLPINLIYLSFALAIGLAFISGLRQREVDILFISLICAVSIVAIIVFVYVDPITVRYVIYLFPFLYLLILSPVKLRPIGYMFISLVLALSLAKFRLAFDTPAPTYAEFWQYIHEQQVTLPAENPLLISEEPSLPYLLLRARSFEGEVTWDLIMTHQTLFLVGSDNFVSTYLTTVERLAETSGFTYKSRNLTADYSDDEGTVLLQLYDFAPESTPVSLEIQAGN